MEEIIPSYTVDEPRLTPLQAFDAAIRLLEDYAPSHPEVAGLLNDFYYSGVYRGRPNTGDTSAWDDWRRAIKRALAEPFNIDAGRSIPGADG